MKLLITPALRDLTEEQKKRLSQKHTLYFSGDESIPLLQQAIDFDPAEIEGIVCNFFFLHNDLSVLPKLRTVQLTSAGLDRVPEAELQAKNISLYNAGSAYAVPMAEWVLAKILEIFKCADFFRKNQTARLWEKRRDIRELSGRTAAIVGFGRVGRAVAERLRPFGVTVRAVDAVNGNSTLADEFFHVSRLAEALRGADIVILTLPLTAETRHIINDEMLSLMKEDAVLVNTARGGIIDEAALIRHLSHGRFYGVALDVFEEEPLDPADALWRFDRVLISPHNAFVGDGNSRRLFETILHNLSQAQIPGIRPEKRTVSPQ